MKTMLVSIVALTCAAAVSIVSLLFVVDVDRSSMGLTTSPYGWKRLIVVHCLASLPLAWLVARALIQGMPAKKSRWSVFVWLAIGLALLSLTVTNGAQLGEGLDANRLDFASRLLVRSLWPPILQIPWCLLVWFMAPRTTAADLETVAMREGIAHPKPAASTRKSANLFGFLRFINVDLALLALAFLVAFVAPVTYEIPLCQQQALRAEELMGAQRPVQASRLLQRLCDIGSARRFTFVDARTKKNVEMSAEEALAVQHNDLARRLSRITDLKKAPLDRVGRFELAQYLAALEATAEARSVLEPIASNDPTVAVELGQLFQEENQRRESSRWFKRALEQVQSTEGATSAEPEQRIVIQSRAYTAMADNARALKQYDEVERYYLEALDRLPSRQAQFHALLARHYEDGGRMLKANEHMKRASEFAPVKYEQPQLTVWLWAILACTVAVYLVFQDFVLA